jgi:hypothetical protein
LANEISKMLFTMIQNLQGWCSGGGENE